MRTLLLTVSLLTMSFGHAQQAESPITGSVSFGARSVDVDGASSKFREDVNLDDGVRLFDVALSYAPGAGESGVVDRVELDAHNLGGDPFETIHLGVRKYGAYKLELDRRRSDYFYQDVILPRALASVNGSTAGDFHEFDFERVRDSASLDIDVSPATRLNFDLDRYTRLGKSTTTLDLQRDEFELDRPIDESLDSYKVGVQHKLDNVTFIFEHDGRAFDNAIDAFLPGASVGENTADPAELQFFMLDQSYDYRSRGNLLRLVARPTDRLDLQAAWRDEDLELQMNASESSTGNDFAGNPFTTDLSGAGSVDRAIGLETLDLGYAVGERLRVIGGVRRLTLEQTGTLIFDGQPGAGAWDIETTGLEAGIEVAAAERVFVSVGLSNESRDVIRSDLSTSDAGETERDGFFARLTFNVTDGFEITASAEDNDIDDPHTLGSPTSSRRYRIHARRFWDSGYSLTASVRRDERANDLSGWAGDTDQTNVRFAYTGDRLSYALGFSVLDLSRNIEQLVTAGTRQDVHVIDYDANAELFDASVRWQVGNRVAIGASVNDYDNGGSYPLEREDLRAYVELALGQDYLARFGYRRLDYTEDGFDDYDADLYEVALGVRW